MTDATDDPKKYCLELVQAHLSSGWKDAKLDDLEFRRIFGGCTSLIFFLKAVNCQPQELIVRFHYANDEETNVYDLKFAGEAGETLVFHILSKLNFGPKLYSVFHGGRIEEYIPSVQLPDEYVIGGLDHEIHQTILRKIAFVHSLNMPIVKDEKWTLRFYENYEQVFKDLQMKKHEIIGQHDDVQVRECLNEIFDFDLINELFWFKECLPKLGCRLVFSHNDITKRNILIRTDLDQPAEQQVKLIDFGDASYNYRGLDLADYLRCRVSITRVIRDGEEIRFYTGEEIEQLCKWYLDEFKKHFKQFDPMQDNLDQLVKEVYYFLLLSDLMTILYITLSTEKNSESHKVNWAYAIKRIALYKDSKKMFFRKYGEQVDFAATL